jgi:hypothetical protein
MLSFGTTFFTSETNTFDIMVSVVHITDCIEPAYDHHVTRDKTLPL